MLNEYLQSAADYDLVCRRHDDLMRTGDSMVRQMRLTKHISILRTYLKYPIPSSIKDELLASHWDHDSSSEFLRELLKHDAHLAFYSERCISHNVLRFIRTLDTLGYDFNWTSTRTGNNILMDYCSCSDTPDQFKWERDAVISYLVKKGVRTDVRNQNGETAYDIARRSGLHPLLKEVEQMEQER